jgi:hypothetical protein
LTAHRHRLIHRATGSRRDQLPDPDRPPAPGRAEIGKALLTAPERLERILR